VVEQVEVLEDHPDLRADCVDIAVRGCDLDVADVDPSGIRSGEQVDASEEGALAGTAGADDDDNFAAVDVQ